ncbi:tol-pal system YbgF family protein [Fibrobacter sp. UWEL]|uniref:tetratricopeptide repeat protein n=1 Tax=Fibrobacter sp. UWEL TaxID=1896209 RepID=UPI0009131C5B|nr:tetratricopeptide repeat protein [Fibrobacter sp. UWEL]SHK89613.1 Tetratricopeptide repeat-containing protein [Fibrobacter sp. UWEL]
MANESNTKNSEMKEFFANHGSKIIAAVLVVMAVVVGVNKYFEFQKSESAEQANLLGKGMSYVYAAQNDSALTEFQAQMNSGKLKGLALAKAALLSGNTMFEKGEFDAAADMFQKSLDNAGSSALIRSAAMHGLASVKIEKADYAAAASLLEKFVGEFGKRTGDLKDRYQKDEPADEVPTVADAMWKLTLVYQQLGQADKAKATAEKLLKVYGDSQNYADKAKKFLAE